MKLKPSKKKPSPEELSEQIRVLESSNHRGWLSFARWCKTTCFGCGSAELSLQPYPYIRDPSFAGLTVLGCATCGVSWVPELPFSLDEYYRQKYAEQNRKDRFDSPLAYFTKLENDPKMAKYVRRANRHAGYLKHLCPSKARVLDYGSGPGYFLFLSKAHCSELMAVEPDQHSHKYLRHLNAKIRSEYDDDPGTVDFLLSSHSLEHLFFAELGGQLKRFHSLLADDGILCAEVPCGTITRHLIISRHAPHTIFFSPESLARELHKAGFSTVRLGSSATKPHALLPEPVYMPSESLDIDGLGPIIALASKRKNDARLRDFDAF